MMADLSRPSLDGVCIDWLQRRLSAVPESQAGAVFSELSEILRDQAAIPWDEAVDVVLVSGAALRARMADVLQAIDTIGSQEDLSHEDRRDICFDVVRAGVDYYNLEEEVIREEIAALGAAWAEGIAVEPGVGSELQVSQADACGPLPPAEHAREGLVEWPYAHADCEQLCSEPSSVLRHSTRCVIWQLSDLHFGKYNQLEENPVELAELVAQVGIDYEEFMPDIIAVSGDVTSVAAKSEFDDFLKFCEALSLRIWDTEAPERLLVVPGNHDTTWLDDGTADRLRGFADNVASSGICLTPFGAAEKDSYADGRVTIERLTGDSSLDLRGTPPVALVDYQEYGLQFVLLVSAYFSGNVPEEIRALIKAPTASKKTLFELLRKDEGEISRNYINNMRQFLSCGEKPRIALIHHNPIRYGVHRCLSSLAPLMLRALAKSGVDVVLHGHTHLIEDVSKMRQPRSDNAYPLPCPTLSSIAHGGCGFSIHISGEDRGDEVLSSMTWELSQTSSFDPDGLVPRCRILLGHNR